MMISQIVKDTFDKAVDIARNMRSEQVCPTHFVLAACEHECVSEALENVMIATSAAKADLTAEAEALPKISEAVEKRYAAAHIERRISSSPEMQMVMVRAESVAHDENIWKTGFIEMSHMMMIILSCDESKALCSLLHCYKTSAQDKKMNDYLNYLIQYEAKMRAIKTGEKTFTKTRTASLAKGDEGDGKMEENISEFCTNLIDAAENDDKPFVGRKTELAALMRCLERRDKPNAILAGPPGVGKTDIVRGLAKMIAEENVHESLKDVKLYSVDIAGMLAGSEYRGTFEKRLKSVLDATTKSMDRPILFIDEIHMVLGAGKTVDSSMDAANILKPYLTEGKIRVIGATTEDEYRKYVESDSAFMRRFQKIDVSEPTPTEAVTIMKGIKPAYESFHGVHINLDAIKSAVDLSVKHMHDRFLPDKAIDIIDQACARVKLDGGKKVAVENIELTIADICKVPVNNIQKDEMSKVKNLDIALKSKVFGQDEAIDSLTEAIQMAKAGLGDEGKPIGSFLFVGPSGVGKTEVSKQLAATLGINFIRFDMSEYAEKHSVSKLIGAPAGYVGYEDGGLLIEKIRQNPNSVVLFDEIEKAHPDIYKVFLQVFDYGMLTDNKGRKADFRNTVIIMTSNAGNSEASRPHIGFGEAALSDRNSTTMKAVSDLMPPELRGRITSTVVFNPLNNDVARLIVKKELNILSLKLKAKGIKARYTEAAIDEIVKRGVSAQYGAREIQKVVDTDVKRPFVKKIISGADVSSYVVDVVDGNFVVSKDMSIDILSKTAMKA